MRNMKSLQLGDYAIARMKFLEHLLRIRADNVSYSHPWGDGGEEVLHTNLSCDLPAGHMIWLRPARPSNASPGASPVSARGMLTLMKLIAGLVQPSPGSGTVQRPPHQNALLVQNEQLMVEGTVMHNLRLGLPRTDDPKQQVQDFKHAIEIATILGLDRKKYLADEMKWVNEHAKQTDAALIQAFEPTCGYAVTPGGDNLRQVDKALICLARALICRPQILLLEKPGAVLSREHKTRVFEALHQYVNFEGIFSQEHDHELTSGRVKKEASVKGSHPHYAHSTFMDDGSEGSRSTFRPYHCEQVRCMINVRTVLFTTNGYNNRPPKCFWASEDSLVAEFEDSHSSTLKTAAEFDEKKER